MNISSNEWKEGVRILGDIFQEFPVFDISWELSHEG